MYSIADSYPACQFGSEILVNPELTSITETEPESGGLTEGHTSIHWHDNPHPVVVPITLHCHASSSGI
jgi:hypothetical protein